MAVHEQDAAGVAEVAGDVGVGRLPVEGEVEEPLLRLEKFVAGEALVEREDDAVGAACRRIDGVGCGVVDIDVVGGRPALGEAAVVADGRVFAGLHRKRREGGVVEPVVDLEAVLHHQRVGAEGRVVDGVKLGLHPAAGAHQRGEAVFVDDASKGIVGVVGAGDVAEGEVLAGVIRLHDGDIALSEADVAHLGAADPGRAAIVRRAEVAPRAQDRCRPDLVSIGAGRAAAEEFHTPKVVVGG